MDQSNSIASQSSRIGNYTASGIVIGSLVGLFAGMYWFEMGLSLLVGTASGLIIGTLFGAIVSRAHKPT
ncbi:MAG: hypothetical protein V2I33_05515 [Kangiellaceae bacterium]|jgi:hypothetical protein|nr:hypothetical protein [Kangiellaceae bacterium]